MSNANDKRIAKNTVFLYGRTLLNIFIQFYSSRVVLEMLGVSNYGIYTAVGGIILIISFINGTMTGATQRFLNYEMGCDGGKHLASTFVASLKIHISIALAIFLIGETFGLWFINTQLVIAPDRLYAANWVYQLSLLAAIFSIIQTPYMATVIAHERMDVFAGLSLLSSILKLAVALLLIFFVNFDTLIVYAWLMLGATVVIFLCYYIYAKKQFAETSQKGDTYPGIIKRLFSFCVSDIIGTSCYTINMQGIIIILNRFGGTVLNAAGSINLIVCGGLMQFGDAITSAFRPQIIKQYASKEYNYMFKLIVNCSNFSTILLALISIPAIINMDYLLSLWLKDVPPYSTIFCQLSLIAAFGDLFRKALNCGVHATGQIFKYSIITGGLYLLEFFLMYALLELTSKPWIIYAVHVVFIMIIVFTVCYIIHKLIPEFQTIKFIKQGILKPLVLILFVFVPTTLISNFFDASFLRLIISGGCSTSLLIISAWFIVLDSTSRTEVRNIIARKLRIH